MQMTADPPTNDRPRGGVTWKYCFASFCGFLTDLAVLKIGVALGLEPAWARVISLFTAMQVTFLINGLVIFRCLEWKCLHRQWASYMAMNAFGNLCNYLVFTTLLSLHAPLWSNHTLAVTIGALVAWMINYCGTRFVVFRKKHVAAPTPAPVVEQAKP